MVFVPPPQMVNLLLNKGANLSASDKKERQPIHWAAYLGTMDHKITVCTKGLSVCMCMR